MIRGFAIFLISLLNLKLNSQSKEKIITRETVGKYQSINLTKSIVLSLSSDMYKGRYIKDSNIVQVQSYLENVLKSQKIKPLDSNYKQFFTIKDSMVGANIIGIYRGDKGSNNAIVLLANYDGRGTINDPEVSDSIFNCANDNASGVAALVQIALFFGKVHVKQNIIFGFTSAKQYSMSGACAMASMIEKNKYKPTMAINIEMIGKKIALSPKKLFIRESDSNLCLPSRLNKFLGDNVFEKHHDPDPIFSIESEDEAFHNILNIPSCTITSFDIDHDEFFLSPKDDVKLIDFDFLHRSIGNITYSVFRLSTED